MNFDIVPDTLIHQDKDGKYVYAHQLHQRYLHGLRPFKYAVVSLFILGLIWTYKTYFLFVSFFPLRLIEDCGVILFLLMTIPVVCYQYLGGRTKTSLEDNRFIQTLFQCVLYVLIGRFVIVQFFTQFPFTLVAVAWVMTANFYFFFLLWGSTCVINRKSNFKPTFKKGDKNNEY